MSRLGGASIKVAPVESPTLRAAHLVAPGAA